MKRERERKEKKKKEGKKKQKQNKTKTTLIYRYIRKGPESMYGACWSVMIST
jgi:hypothetical protein